MRIKVRKIGKGKRSSRFERKLLELEKAIDLVNLAAADRLDAVKDRFLSGDGHLL